MGHAAAAANLQQLATARNMTYTADDAVTAPVESTNRSCAPEAWRCLRAMPGSPSRQSELRPAGGAKAARLVLVDGLAGAVVSVGGRPMAVFGVSVREGA